MDKEDICHTNPFRSFGKQDCVNHKTVNCKNGSGVYLQCGHTVCHGCIHNIIRNTFGEEMCTATIDKRNIYNFNDENTIEKDNYFIMKFSTEETSGIIKCPDCNTCYSILSPIYRDFGYPKRIETAIAFKHKDQVLFYYICTAIDAVHLLRKDKQIKILENFDYTKENELLENLTSKDNPEIYELTSQSDYYIAVKTKNSLFTLIEFDEYDDARKSNDKEEKNKYEPCTIEDFVSYLNLS